MISFPSVFSSELASRTTKLVKLNIVFFFIVDHRRLIPHSMSKSMRLSDVLSVFVMKSIHGAVFAESETVEVGRTGREHSYILISS